MQPEASLNFWFDDAFISKAHIENTREILKNMHLNLNKINFKPLRSIGLIKDYHDMFEQNIPIFFRIDLAKAIIGYHELSRGILYSLNIDSDVIAISRQQLFDQNTLHNLTMLGLVLGVALTVYEENSFIILYANAKVNIKDTYFEIIIKESVETARKLLQEKRPIEPQIVFRKYAALEMALKKHCRNISGESCRKYNFSKNMLFPPSALGGGGYSMEQLNALKMALLGPKGCP